MIAESFGQINNPYPREYAALEPDADLLARLARATNGRLDPTVPQNPNDDPQQMNVYTFVFPGSTGGSGGGGPVIGPHGPIGGMGPR